MAHSSTIAVVFDFDDTLVPDSTSMLLQEHGIDPNPFWNKELKALVTAGYDPTLGFLKLFLERVGPGKPLGDLNNARLREFGKQLDRHFHPGLPDLFQDLRAAGSELSVTVEFFVVSGGLQAIIEGSQIIQNHFKAAYGCVLGEGGNPVCLADVKRAINFTEKTRYLFEISKGLSPHETAKNPYLVNEDIAKSRRPVQLRNMIYVGDGLTDIPCFSLLKRSGGLPFGVFDPTDEKKSKRALSKFLMPQRVISMNEPRYRKTDALGSLLRAAVTQIATRIVLEQRSAEPSDSDD